MSLSNCLFFLPPTLRLYLATGRCQLALFIKYITACCWGHGCLMKIFLWQKTGSCTTSRLPRGCVKYHREQSQWSTAAGEETGVWKNGQWSQGVRVWYNPATLTWTGMKWVCVFPVDVLVCQVSGRKHICHVRNISQLKWFNSTGMHVTFRGFVFHLQIL